MKDVDNKKVFYILSVTTNWNIVANIITVKFEEGCGTYDLNKIISDYNFNRFSSFCICQFNNTAGVFVISSRIDYTNNIVTINCSDNYTGYREVNIIALTTTN